MSEDPTAPPTQPTLETVLERINALGEKFSAEISKVHDNLSADMAKVRSDLSAELQSFREEVLEKFAQVNDRLEVLSEEWLDIRGEQKRQRKRIDEMERKAS